MPSPPCETPHAAGGAMSPRRPSPPGLVPRPGAPVHPCKLVFVARARARGCRRCRVGCGITLGSLPARHKTHPSVRTPCPLRAQLPSSLPRRSRSAKTGIFFSGASGLIINVIVPGAPVHPCKPVLFTCRALCTMPRSAPGQARASPGKPVLSIFTCLALCTCITQVRQNPAAFPFLFVGERGWYDREGGPKCS